MVIKKKDLTVDSVFSVEVPGYGYILAQLRDDHCMDVFDNLKDVDDWYGEDLNEREILFTIVVASHRLLTLFKSNVTSVVKVNTRPRCLIALRFSEELRTTTKMPGLSLVKHDPVYNPNNKNVLIPLLDPVLHKEILYSYEYWGMHGNPKEILERITCYYETGVNFDKSKMILYPELAPPPKGYRKVSYSPNCFGDSL